jgi:hypothetical protein
MGAGGGMIERVKVTVTVPGFPNLSDPEPYDASIPFESIQHRLDAWNAIPVILRYTSTEPKEGYYWDPEWGIYFENDELFRARVKCVSVAHPHEWRGPMGTETTAPADTKPNHVRDAVRANP